MRFCRFTNYFFSGHLSDSFSVFFFTHIFVRGVVRDFTSSAMAQAFFRPMYLTAFQENVCIADLNLTVVIYEF